MVMQQEYQHGEKEAEREARRVERVEKLAQEAKLAKERSEDKTLDRDERERAARASNDLMRQLGEERNQLMRENIDIRKQQVAKEKAPTEGQARAGLYHGRASEAHDILTKMEGQYSPAMIGTKQGLESVWGIGGALGAGANLMMPKNEQKAEQAQRNFYNALLRQESGATIQPSEFAEARKQYFPQVGDSPEVLLQKKQNRETAIEGLRVMAGPAVGARQAASQQAPAAGPKQPKQPKRLKFDAQGNPIP